MRDPAPFESFAVFNSYLVENLPLELKRLRRTGVLVRGWRRNAQSLLYMARQIYADEELSDSDVVERMLTEAARRLDDGEAFSTAAMYLYGLEKRYRSLPLGDRRDRAATVLQVDPETVRKRYEPRINSGLVDQIFSLLAESRARRSRD